MSLSDPQLWILPLHAILKDLYRNVIQSETGLKWDQPINEAFIPRIYLTLGRYLFPDISESISQRVGAHWKHSQMLEFLDNYKANIRICLLSDVHIFNLQHKHTEIFKFKKGAQLTSLWLSSDI